MRFAIDHTPLRFPNCRDNKEADIAVHNMSTLIHPIKEARVTEIDPALPAPDWPDDIFAALKAAGIRQIGYVPDAGHTRLIERCQADPEIRAVGLTSEEEGIGLAAGAWLGGQRAALLMQSSGVGNCINMLSLAKSCRFPLTLLITMRGEWGEFNPWQVPMGTKTQAALELMDTLVYRVEREGEAGETVAAALDIAFNGGLVTAVLLSQRLIGAKRWVK
jgi:sulfopyruvate decarboxylase alpha subunit